MYCEFLPFTGRPDPPVNLHYNVTTKGEVIFRWSGTQPDSNDINYEIRYSSNSLTQQWEVIGLICCSDEYVVMALQNNVCENYVKGLHSIPQRLKGLHSISLKVSQLFTESDFLPYTQFYKCFISCMIDDLFV